MGFKEIISKLGEKSKEKKQKFREMDDFIRMQQMIEDRTKSANERELERFQKEEREEQIKEALEFQRKKRQHDINFNHNALDAPNITNHTEWEVLKEKNQFANNKNMFIGQKSVLKSNRNLLKNNKKLYGI